ncbi:transmembrane protease serine 5 isoform X2 [Sarcophilus harrisii]|uniref:transmembrane protease serine 5 isoform X2 n=1 Tax=Sarcophilus harrisii TaxID=9305 RepID=UPI000C7C42BF|nr:transmembrane protease serine 5 isoform X2 [Sarcophilus harrisii]
MDVNLVEQHDLEGPPEVEASRVPETPEEESGSGPEIIEYQEEFHFPNGYWIFPRWGKRGLIFFMTIGLIAGISVGIWLLVLLFRTHSLLKVLKQNNVMSCTEKPPIPITSKSVSFRINTINLLEVQVREWPDWLLVCHEGWSPTLGNRICRHLGHLRLTYHKEVNLTDIKVNNSQEFVQLLPKLGNLLEIWQHRNSCTLGQVVSLKCSECGIQPLTSRIIGGTSAALGRWPWQVSMFKGSQYSCGASVLDPSWVVTAGHCVYKLSHKSKWRIFVGIVNHSDIVSHMGTMVEKIILHPHFRIHKQKHDYDIALLKLQTPLNFSSTVQAVCLPEMQQDFPQGSKCWVSGWGSTVPHQGFGSDILQNVLVPLISSQLCNSSCMYKGLITPQMLCAGYLDGHADSCQGDSGGPLVCLDQGMWRLVGIVSWGWDCGIHHRPGVYTKVAVFLDWIHHQIAGELVPEDLENKYIKERIQDAIEE